MIERVLVPIDDSEVGERVLGWALGAYPDAEITVLHVVGGASGMMGEATGLALADDVEAASEEMASGVFERASAVAAESGREVETKVGFGRPAGTIVAAAEGFDTVVMGAHSSPLVERLLTGNVAESVFRNSPVPVTFVR
jgi:nucleotide-binding universal stress UspA family protein